MFLARAGAAARARHPRRVAARAGAHDRDVRAHVPDRGPGFADAGRRALLRGVRRRRARAAVGRRDGDDLHGRHARLAADRAALRQSDAAREPRQGAPAGSADAPSPSDDSVVARDARATLPPTVARARLRLAAGRVGIVHLGLGAFHRAHQAVYTDGVLARDPRWGICGGQPQDAARDRRRSPRRTACTRCSRKATAATRARVIGARARGALPRRRSRPRVARIADPRRAASCR